MIEPGRWGCVARGSKRPFAGVSVFGHEDAFGLLDHRSRLHRRVQLFHELGGTGVQGGVGHRHCGIAGEGLRTVTVSPSSG